MPWVFKLRRLTVSEPKQTKSSTVPADCASLEFLIEEQIPETVKRRTLEIASVYPFQPLPSDPFSLKTFCFIQWRFFIAMTLIYGYGIWNL